MQYGRIGYWALKVKIAVEGPQKVKQENLVSPISKITSENFYRLVESVKDGCLALKDVKNSSRIAKKQKNALLRGLLPENWLYLMGLYKPRESIGENSLLLYPAIGYLQS